jgi:hypothetical protein
MENFHFVQQEQILGVEALSDWFIGERFQFY